jgi:hypothetical protein
VKLTTINKKLLTDTDAVNWAMAIHCSSAFPENNVKLYLKSLFNEILQNNYCLVITYKTVAYILLHILLSKEI